MCVFTIYISSECDDDMFELIPIQLLKLLIISIMLSIIMTIFIQKIKNLNFIQNDNQLWFVNIILSFCIGIPFSIFFYKLNIYEGLWISFFSFLSVKGVYLEFKNQNMSKDNRKIQTIEISKENFINRGDIY